MTLSQAPPPPPPAGPVVTVDREGLQPHLDVIGWQPAPEGETGPLVAVLDTGIDGTHPGLREVVDIGASRSFMPGSPNPLEDREGHGTHVAGLIAARGDRSPVQGICECRLLIVKIADASGQASTSAMVRGIRYATARGARIINISFGGGGASPLEQEAIDAAVRRGALIVAASGNSGTARREFPGAYRHVLAVAAVDGDDRPLATSTSGQQVAIAAPGDALVSSLPGGYGKLSGTSMAAAVVSGVAARVWAARPTLTASQVAQILVNTARDLGPPGPDPGTGAGMVDLAGALQAPVPLSDTAEPNDDAPMAARTRPGLAGVGTATALVRARVGPWRDPRDLYRVTLAAGDTLTASLRGPASADFDLRLWRPHTPAFRPGPAFPRTWLAGAAIGATATERLTFTATTAGVYSIEVQAGRGSGVYRLDLARTAAGTAPAGPTGTVTVP